MTPRDYTSFVGNLSAADAFTTLYYAESPDADVEGGSAGKEGGKGGNLLIGARNIMYKLSAAELRLTQTLLWHSSDFDRESCSVKVHFHQHADQVAIKLAVWYMYLVALWLGQLTSIPVPWVRFHQ